MKSCIFTLISLTMFATLAMSQEQKTVTLKGKVRDYKSTMPLAAQIKIIYADDQLPTQETLAKADGSFEINTLPKMCVIQATTQGYIVSNVLVNFEKLGEPNVQIEIPLVFKGKTKINQLLFEFASQKKEKEVEQDTGVPKNKQLFQAIDAIDNKVVAAQFSIKGLYKNSFVNKKTTQEASVFEHNFTEREHIILNVSAEGYQNFLSEIDIETFNKTIHENTAKLVKKVSFLNLIIKNEAELQNINVFERNNGTQKQVGLAKTNGMYFGSLITGALYKVTIDTKIAKEITQEFTAIEGLNQVVITLEAKADKSPVIAENKPITPTETKVVQLEKQAYTPDSKPISLENQVLYFDQSSTVLNQASKEILEEISKKMLASPETKIEITGHTDNTGDSRQNLYLSEFRAKVISNFLYNKGIKTHRIILHGNGSKAPSTGNDTEENRQKNRRAELRFY